MTYFSCHYIIFIVLYIILYYYSIIVIVPNSTYECPVQAWRGWNKVTYETCHKINHLKHSITSKFKFSCEHLVKQALHVSWMSSLHSYRWNPVSVVFMAKNYDSRWMNQINKCNRIVYTSLPQHTFSSAYLLTSIMSGHSRHFHAHIARHLWFRVSDGLKLDQWELRMDMRKFAGIQKSQLQCLFSFSCRCILELT